MEGKKERASPWGPLSAQGIAPGAVYNTSYSLGHKHHRRVLWPWREVKSEVLKVRRRELPS